MCKEISVIVPAYNSEATIAACVESILAQSYAGVQLVVVDDGSTDGTAAIADSIASRDDRMTVVHQPNKGRTEARRVGVEQARGEWICFVDSDDTLPTDALENLAQGISDDTDIVFGNGHSLPEQRQRTVIPIDEFCHLAVRAEGTIGVPWGSLYRRSAMTPRLFDLPRHIMMGEDYIFWLRLVFSTEKPVSIVYKDVYCKGEEHTSNSFRWTAAYAYELNELRKEAIPQERHEEFMADMLSDRLANMLSVAQWSRRSDWADSPFYRELLADMKRYGISTPLKTRFFLSLPSLRLRRLYSWGSDHLKHIDITRPISSNLTFFFFLCLFGSVCIISERWTGSRLLGLIELLFDVYLLCLFVMLIPDKKRKFISRGLSLPGVRSMAKVLLSGCLYVIGFIDMWCYYVLHMPITATLLQLVLQTNSQESREALGAYWHSSVLISPLGLLLIIAAAHVAVSLLGIGIGKRLMTIIQRPRTRILTALLLCASLVMSLPDRERLVTAYLLELSPEEAEQKELFFNVEWRAYLYLPVYRLFAALMQTNRYKHEMERLPIVAAGTHVEQESTEDATIVLIIGESYNRRHSQLYGYPLETTPFQMKRLNNGEITLFSDVVSPWNLTSLSFQDMFSMQTQEPQNGQQSVEKEWYDYPLFTTMFRRAGYEVTFLSNQYVLSLEGRLSDFIEDMFVNEPSMSNYQFSYRNASTHQFDDGLLADYDSLKAISRASSPASTAHGGRLVIFHFLGLHAAFSERYPAENAYFSPSDYTRNDLSSADLQTLVDYDNTMRYNDTVIEGILSRMEQEEAIVVCLADHGERIFDYGTTSYGRSMAMTKESVHQLYDIPFWIWCSETYKQQHPDIYEQIVASKDKPWTTAHLGQLMLYLGRISSREYYHDEANILSPRFERKKRSIAGKYCYEDY